jgi:hypothetical protein
MQGPRFTVGEEVLYDGRRFVIAGTRPGPYGFRLLAASDRHDDEADIVWAAEAEMTPLESYVRPRHDTDVG